MNSLSSDIDESSLHVPVKVKVRKTQTRKRSASIAEVDCVSFDPDPISDRRRTLTLDDIGDTHHDSSSSDHWIPQNRYSSSESVDSDEGTQVDVFEGTDILEDDEIIKTTDLNEATSETDDGDCQIHPSILSPPTKKASNIMRDQQQIMPINFGPNNYPKTLDSEFFTRAVYCADNMKILRTLESKNPAEMKALCGLISGGNIIDSRTTAIHQRMLHNLFSEDH
jgi:hypothetical protein